MVCHLLPFAKVGQLLRIQMLNWFTSEIMFKHLGYASHTRTGLTSRTPTTPAHPGEASGGGGGGNLTKLWQIIILG